MGSAHESIALPGAFAEPRPGTRIVAPLQGVVGKMASGPPKAPRSERVPSGFRMAGLPAFRAGDPDCKLKSGQYSGSSETFVAGGVVAVQPAEEHNPQLKIPEPKASLYANVPEKEPAVNAASLCVTM